LLLFGFWLAFETQILTNLVVSELSEAVRDLPESRLNLFINDIKNLVIGSL
jgi:hypothetical protein